MNMHAWRAYAYTARMAWRAKTNGGVLGLLPDAALRVLYLVPLLIIWRTVMNQGVQVGMSLAQMLTYTYTSALLSQQLTVRTAASNWLYEGLMIDLYARPMGVFGQLIAQTMGGWMPLLLTFSLPMALCAPLVGVSLLPASGWFFLSLVLCVTLGFALDFLFTCVTIRLQGMSWLVYSIRTSIVSLLAGSVIPFRLLPFGWGEVLAMQPFASLAGAPLSLISGTAAPARVVLLQLFWNAVLWPLAIWLFRKSRERMMSYGG